MRSLLRNKLVLVLIVGAGIVLLNLAQHDVRGLGRSFTAFVQSWLWETGSETSRVFKGAVRGPSLFGQVQELREENLRLRQELLENAALAQENRQLRDALDVGVHKEFEVELVRIVGKAPSRDLLFLNKGMREGFREGMPVITNSKVAVGHITEVFEATSELLLVSDKESSFDAKLEGKGTVAVLRGEGSSRAVLDLVPLESDIQPQDLVLTSSLGRLFPENLLVGAVRGVRKSDLEAFQQAEVDLFFTPQSEATLFVILNHEE